MNILVDIDGVVCQYDFQSLTTKFFGAPIQNEGVWCYSLEDTLGVPTEDVVAMFNEACWYPPNFMSGALEALDSLVQTDTVYIYSNREYFMGADGLRRWLSTYGVPFSDLWHRDNGLGDIVFDFHVDDSPTKLMCMGEQTQNKLLYDSPWNAQCLNITGELIRVFNWRQIKEAVDYERDSRVG